MGHMDRERMEKLTPNNLRTWTEPTRNPADIRPLAAQLLSEAALAATLTEPGSARREAKVESDSLIHKEDGKLSDTLFANAAVETLRTQDSLLAPIIKRLARRRSKRARAAHAERSRIATQGRMDHVLALETSGKTYLHWNIQGKVITDAPLDLHWSHRRAAVWLTPYQLQACGVVEVVRAAGRVLGRCEGDWLADQFMRFILDLSGEGDWQRGREGLSGGFLALAEGSSYLEVDWSDWKPLSGRDQLLAVTVLAAWIRMGRLGVSLGSKERMGQWRNWFDGTSYGVVAEHLGEVWSRREWKVPAHEVAEIWRGSARSPWLLKPGGAPVPVIGVAGEILRRAVIAVQDLGLVPDHFELDEETELEPCYRESSRILVQLKKAYREIAGSPLGSVVWVSAPDHWS